MGKMRQFRRALRAAIGRPLAFSMKDGFGVVASELLEGVVRGARVHDDQVFEMFGDPREEATAFGGRVALDEDGGRHRVQHIAMAPMIIPGVDGGKGTAIITMRGIALYDMEYQPICFSTRLFAQAINQLAAMPDIGTIMIDVDTPGGSVIGVPEAADAVFQARKRKHVVALVNPLCASAGYYIASQASEIIAIPSADVGSIGVFMAHTDCSSFNERQGLKITYIFAGEHKVEGNSDEPLSEEAKARFQSEVDTIYAGFIRAVARGRKRKEADVLEHFGKGRCLMAADAKEAGLIDEIATIDSALARFGVVQMPVLARGRRAGAVGLPTVGDTSFAQPILLRVEATDGRRVHALDAPWPQWALIAPSAMEPLGAAGVQTDAGFEITLENARAVYAKVGETISGDFLCALQPGSTYEPRQKAASSDDASTETTTDPAPPEETGGEAGSKAAPESVVQTPEAEEEQRKAAALARARRLAVLKRAVA